MTPPLPDPPSPVRSPRRHGRPANLARDLSIFLVGASVGLAALLVVQRLWPRDIDPDVAHYLEVRRFVLDNYVEEVDPEELVKSALSGMLGELDQYSAYYDEPDARRVDRETRGRFTGIGVVFRGPLELGQVLFALNESPAEEAGIRVGDRILTIDGVEIAGLSEEEVRHGLEGEQDSVVELKVVGRDGATRTHEVRRRSVLDPSVRHARILDPELGLGYLALTSFSHETPREFDRAFEWLLGEGMQGLVLDLRYNPGGVLASAVEVARRFLDSGVIVSTRDRYDTTTLEADSSHAPWVDLPLVVLVNEYSASASEVLAGALQDHRAAVIVGAPTHGKGMVQTICRYPMQGTIAKVTTSRYYTPSLRNLERNPKSGRDFGIVPDLEVTVTPQEHERALGFIDRYGVPPDKLPELRRWEAEESLKLVLAPPSDPQLEAALGLLRGERPATLASRSER